MSLSIKCAKLRLNNNLLWSKSTGGDSGSALLKEILGSQRMSKNERKKAAPKFIASPLHQMLHDLYKVVDVSSLLVNTDL